MCNASFLNPCPTGTATATNPSPPSPQPPCLTPPDPTHIFLLRRRRRQVRPSVRPPAASSQIPPSPPHSLLVEGVDRGRLVHVQGKKKKKKGVTTTTTRIWPPRPNGGGGGGEWNRIHRFQSQLNGEGHILGSRQALLIRQTLGFNFYGQFKSEALSGRRSFFPGVPRGGFWGRDSRTQISLWGRVSCREKKEEEQPCLLTRPPSLPLSFHGFRDNNSFSPSLSLSWNIRFPVVCTVQH